jgi:predicted ATPase/DNA-binding SARP family transcriptional activator
VRVCLLGPVEVTDGLRRLPLGGVKERLVLAVLALNANRVVSEWTLVDALWADATPSSGVKALHHHVHRLRGRLEQTALGEHRLATRPGGYVLRLAPDELDATIAELLLAEGRAAWERGEVAAAAGQLAEADALWRGQPLGDLANYVAVRDDSIRLAELRDAVLEALADAELAAGHHGALVSRLEMGIARAPLRERLWEQLILALYRCGRQSDALGACHRCRHLLREELGIDPNRNLVALEEAILLQKPELDWHPHEHADSAGWVSSRRSLDMDLHNLPVQLTPLIGRTGEIAEIRGQLTNMRLVTLTGAPGVGKTRLALAVAAEAGNSRPAGVWFVELAALSDPDAIGPAVLAAMGAREAPGASAAHQLAVELGDRPSLVVLDNCEHLIGGCAQLVAELLAATPSTSVLATSRELLGVPGEITFNVPSLRCPNPAPSLDPATAATYDAVLLFAERARRARPSFAIDEANVAAITQICHRLDGIPLAIELAAACCRHLSVHHVAAELDHRFRLLTAGARTVLPRHRTLAASIDWSYEHLADVERATFRRLGVFAGPFPPDAAATVVAEVGDIDATDVFGLVNHLVDKSLVAVDEHPRTEIRYRLLETLRSYALDRTVDAGEGPVVRDAHAVWWADWLEPRGAMPTDEALDEIGEYHDNIAAALDWTADKPHVGLRLLRAVARPWESTGRTRDAVTAADVLLADDNANRYPLEWLTAANAASGLYWRARGIAANEALLERVERVARQLGDDYQLALAQWHKDSPSGNATAERDACRRVRDTARTRGDRFLEAAATIGLASSLAEEEPVTAASVVLQAQSLAAASGNRDLRAAARMVQAQAAATQGDLAASIALTQDVLRDDTSVTAADAVRVLGFAALLARDLEALRIAVGAGDRALRISPGVALFAEDARHRLQLLNGQPSAIDPGWGEAYVNQPLPTIGFLWLAGREALDAGATNDAVQRVREWTRPVPHAQAVLAAIEAAATANESRWHDALKMATNHNLRLIAVDALEGLANNAASVHSWAESLRLLGAAQRLREETGYQWRFATEQQSVRTSRSRAIEALGTAADAADNEGRALDWRTAAVYAHRAHHERKPPNG